MQAQVDVSTFLQKCLDNSLRLGAIAGRHCAKEWRCQLLLIKTVDLRAMAQQSLDAGQIGATACQMKATTSISV